MKSIPALISTIYDDQDYQLVQDSLPAKPTSTPQYVAIPQSSVMHVGSDSLSRFPRKGAAHSGRDVYGDPPFSSKAIFLFQMKVLNLIETNIFLLFMLKPS